ncbi:MAG: hypothetical protein ACI4L6_00390 [Candidatus Onthoplasma sp.]
MKKFTRILVCCLLCVFSFFIFGCEKQSEKDKNFTYPTSADVTIGNRGLAVQKGNYLYFVNGYKAVSDLTASDQNATNVYGSLMVAKLDENGQIVLDKNNLLKDDHYNTMTEQLCGFNATNLFISGNYLYFTSPSNGNKVTDENKKVWQKELVVFNRIALDKNGGVEKIYETEVTYSNLEFEYFDNAGQCVILVREKGTSDSKLFRIVCGSKISVGTSNKISNVTDLKISGDNVFFVQKVESNYVLKKFDVINNSTIELATKSTEMKIEAVGEEFVFVSVENDGNNELYKYNYLTHQEQGLIASAVGSYSQIVVTKYDETLIVVDGNQILFLRQGADQSDLFKEEDTTIDSDATSITILANTNGGVVYYDNNKNIKFVSYSHLDGKTDKTAPVTLATISDISSSLIDVSDDTGYMYFFKTVGSNKYLFRLDIKNPTAQTEEMIGVYKSSDVPKAEVEE